MLTQGKFLISYQIFDNIQVNNIGQTHVREILKDTQAFTIRQIPLEQNKEVQTKIKEIIYNNLYDTLVDELKGTISRFQAQYNIQEINPYLQDILQNPGDLVSLSQHHK